MNVKIKKNLKYIVGIAIAFAPLYSPFSYALYQDTTQKTGLYCVGYIKTYPDYKDKKYPKENIKGDAWQWWSSPLLTQSNTPSVGSVLVFPKASWNGYYGHVAYVSKIVSATEILVNHANWNPTKFHGDAADRTVWKDVRVQTSDGWKTVRFEIRDKGKDSIGPTPYTALGFVNKNPPVALKELSELKVMCPPTLKPNASAPCSAQAYFNDKSNNDVTKVATWATNSSYATIKNGIVTSKLSASNVPIKITATYKENNITKSASYTSPLLGVDGRLASDLGCVQTWSGSKSVAGATFYLYRSKVCNTSWAKVVPQNSRSIVYASVSSDHTGKSFSSSKANAPTPMLYLPSGKACVSGKIDSKTYSKILCN